MAIPKEFILRRLHSLTGIAPMGLFLFEHFFTNSYSYQGEAVYNEKVHFLRTLPYLFFIEWGALFLPFLFHIFYGFAIMYSGSINVQHHGYPRNWLYVLQRLSAIPAFFFIIFHVVSLRFWPHGEGEPNFYKIMIDVFANPFYLAFYIVGVSSICFHFANGISTFCMTWGITISPTSQKMVGYACAAVGIGLAGMAINSIFGFRPEGLQKAAEAVQHLPKATSCLILVLNQVTA